MVSIIPQLTQDDFLYLNTIFKDVHTGQIVPVKADELNIKNELFRGYCHYNAIYGIATQELINLIHELLIPGYSLEIGAGLGTFGRALKIPMIDNFMQAWPPICEYYKSMGQPTIKYPKDVEKMDANAAIKYYRPKVVFGSWITHIYDVDKPANGGNVFGIDEQQMFDDGVEKYLMYGHESTHQDKPLLHHPAFNVQKIKKPFMYSRSGNKGNVLYVITPK